MVAAMNGVNHAFLARALATGVAAIGQIRISAAFSLTHMERGFGDDVPVYRDPYDALEIAKYDAAGKYRPLKSAPNLRADWRLELATLDEVLLALDFFYPAAVATARELDEGSLSAVDLRSTLARQTGMYAVVKKLTDEQAGDLIASACNSKTGCLRRLLWEISAGQPSALTESCGQIRPGAGEIPLLCAEACNLLVAAGRGVVKAAQKQAEAAGQTA